MYLPGPITAFIGLPGAGKSFYALKIALQQANDLKLKHLVCNFDINEKVLYEYCIRSGFIWLTHRIPRGLLICQDINKIAEWLKIPNALYILDEAGIYLNSREFDSKDQDKKAFLQSVAKIRHKNRLLFWIAQYYEQVDRIIRDLTASVVHCDSLVRHNKELGNLEIYWQKAFLYDATGWKIYQTKIDGKSKGFKAMFRQKQISLSAWMSGLGEADKMIFEMYKSFGDEDFAEAQGCQILNPVKKIGYEELKKIHERSTGEEYTRNQLEETIKLTADNEENNTYIRGF